jgi:hypothetical protein
MPRFYFHLCHYNECILDEVGCDLPDIGAVHAKAKLLARRVMTFSSLASHEPDWRHWTVTVTADRRGPILSVTFATFIDDVATNVSLLRATEAVDRIPA